jgi:imidazolonepropionase-like amidohydrolase
VTSRIHFNNVTLLDGLTPAQYGVSVVIEDERIISISDAPIEAGPDDAVFDLTGQTVMPGMYSCLFHASYDNVNSILSLDLNHPPTMLTLIAAKNLRMLLMSGYTGAVGAGCSHYIDVTLRNAVNMGLIPGPRLMACGGAVVTTGDSGDSYPSWWELGIQGLGRPCDGEDEFRKTVREEIKNGVDIVKLFVTGGHGQPLSGDRMSMTEAELRAAIDAAHSRGKKIRGHIAGKQGILTAAKAGIDIIDHADGIDQECIDAMVEHGTTLVPSVYQAWHLIDAESRDDFTYSSALPDKEASFEAHRQWLPVADAAGIPILLGDDFGLGWMPHGTYGREFLALNALGIDPLTVIRWATLNGAAFHGHADDVGSIEAGKRADLLMVDGAPGEDIRVLADSDNMLAVMKNGHFEKCSLHP